MSDIRETLKERGGRYGKFIDNAQIAVSIMDILRQQDNFAELAADQIVALELIAQKIGRILSGDVNYDDNWRDIAGYAQLIVDRLNGTGCYEDLNARDAKEYIGGLAIVQLKQCGGPDQLAGDCCASCYRPVGYVHAADCKYVQDPRNPG